MNDERLHPQEIRRLEQHASSLYSPAPWLEWAAIGCLALGVIGFVVGLMVSPGHAWGALLVNFLFWTGLSMASLAVAATFNVSYAWWGRSVQRITAALATFMPFSLIPFIVLWFGRRWIFWWIDEPNAGPWRQIGPLFLRDGLVLATCAGLAVWSLYRAIRPDMGALIEEGTVENKGFAAWITRGWTDDEHEQLKTMRTLKMLSPANIIAYALGFSLIVIDMEMTIQPGFRSTMFPVIYWISQYFAAFAAASLLMSLWRQLESLHEIFSIAHVQDLGNMLWGSSIFTAYVTWSQYFVIWMGNLPAEAAYIGLRWRTMPWAVLSWTMLACTFLAPFFLLFARGLKRTPAALGTIGGIAILGVLLQRYLDVYPALRTLGGSDFGLVEITVSIGFLGAMALPYLWLMRRVPVFPIEDPLFLRGLETRGVEV